MGSGPKFRSCCCGAALSFSIDLIEKLLFFVLYKYKKNESKNCLIICINYLFAFGDFLAQSGCLLINIHLWVKYSKTFKTLLSLNIILKTGLLSTIYCGMGRETLTLVLMLSLIKFSHMKVPKKPEIFFLIINSGDRQE